MAQNLSDRKYTWKFTINFFKSHHIIKMGKQPIEIILSRAEKSLLKIQKEYQIALHIRAIPASLRNQIKDYCLELRLALDSIAHEITNKYYPHRNNRPAFPVFTEQTDFLSAMEKEYPDLLHKNQRIFSFLENIQPYKRAENSWLDYFNKLTAESKYDKLIPQKKLRQKRIDVYSQINGAPNWNIRNQKLVLDIVTGVPANEVWVTFQFEEIPVSALWLIHESLRQIRQLYHDLKPELAKIPLDLYPSTKNEAVYIANNNFPAYANGNH